MSRAIFVTDTGNGRIQGFDRFGRFQLAFDGGVAGQDRLVEPTGITDNGSGGMWVVDRGLGQVRVFDSDGIPHDVYGSQGSQLGEFDAPTGISRDHSQPGYVVADTGNRRVVMLGVNGQVNRVISDLGSAPSAALVLKEEGQRFLVVPNAARSGLTVANIQEDPPGQGPVDTVTSFLAALRRADFAAARELLTSDNRENFDRALETEESRSALVQMGREAGEMKVLSRYGSMATVEVRIDEGRKGSRQVSVHRQSQTGAWLIDN